MWDGSGCFSSYIGSMCRCVLPEENSAATCVFCDVRAVMVSLAGREVVEAEWFVKAMSGDRQDAAEFLSGFIDVLLRNSEGEPRFTSIFRQQSRIIQTCERERPRIQYRRHNDAGSTHRRCGDVGRDDNAANGLLLLDLQRRRSKRS